MYLLQYRCAQKSKEGMNLTEHETYREKNVPDFVQCENYRTAVEGDSFDYIAQSHSSVAWNSMLSALRDEQKCTAT